MANISAVQATHGIGINKMQLIKIWVVSKELASKPLRIVQNYVSIMLKTAYFGNSPLTIECYGTEGLTVSSSMIPYRPRKHS